MAEWKTLRVPTDAYEKAKAQKEAHGRTWGQQIVRDADTGHVEAACTVCRWKFFRSHADELSGLSGDPMDEIIDRQATAHELATDHKVLFMEKANE